LLGVRIEKREEKSEKEEKEEFRVYRTNRMRKKCLYLMLMLMLVLMMTSCWMVVGCFGFQMPLRVSSDGGDADESVVDGPEEGPLAEKRETTTMMMISSEVVNNEGCECRSIDTNGTTMTSLRYSKSNNNNNNNSNNNSSPLEISNSTTCSNCVFGPQGDYPFGVVLTYVNVTSSKNVSIVIEFVNCTFRDNDNRDLEAVVSIQGLHITNGCTVFNVTFESCHFENNNSTGVAIRRFYSLAEANFVFRNTRFVQNSNSAVALSEMFTYPADSLETRGSVLFFNCSFVDNAVDLGAAAINASLVSWMPISVVNSLFENNKGSTGAFTFDGILSFCEIRNCSFFNNRGQSFGGAVFVNDIGSTGGGDSFPAVVIEHSVFEFNFVGGSVVASGGAIGISISSLNPVWIYDCLFGFNEASARGGAVYISNALTNITQARFYGNQSPSGGALYVENFGTAFTTIYQASFEQDYAINGGDIFVDSGQLKLNNARFKSSTSVSSGGAIFAARNSEVIITDTSFVECGTSSTQCTANSDCGGGAALIEGELGCTHCTFDRNYILPHGPIDDATNAPYAVLVIDGGAFDCHFCIFENHGHARERDPRSAVYITGTASLVSTVFRNNSGSLGVMTAYYYNHEKRTTVVMEDCVVWNQDYSGLYSDTISLGSGQITVRNSSFEGSVTLSIDLATVNISNSRLLLNENGVLSLGDNGALYIENSIVAPALSINQNHSIKIFIDEGAVHFVKATFINASIEVSANVHLVESVLEGSFLNFSYFRLFVVKTTILNSTITVQNAKAHVWNSYIDPFSIFNSQSSSLIDIKSSVLATPVITQNSNLSIMNSTFEGNTKTEDVVCIGNANNITIEMSQFRLSPNCHLEFVPLQLNSFVESLEVVSNGASGTDYFDLVIDQNFGGARITFDLNKTISGLINNDWTTNLYLVAAPCQYNMDIQSFNHTQTTTQQLPAVISFNGPSPDFFHPDPTSVTHFCLVRNTTNALIDRYWISTEFFPRSVTTSTIAFVNGRYQLYSKKTVIQYSLLDQWGDLISVNSPMNITCSDQLCGSTYAGLSMAEKQLSFDFISPDWKFYTKVYMSLPYQQEEAILYGKEY